MANQTPRPTPRIGYPFAVAALIGIASCTYDFDAFSPKPDATWTSSDAPQETGGALATGGAPATGGALATGGELATGGALATGGVTTSQTGQPGTGGIPSQGGGGTTPTTTGGQAGHSTQAPGSGGVPGTGGTTGSAITCSGSSQTGICWYLGSSGSSCQQTCASHGQTAPEAAAQIGTSKQGGSLAKCASLLDLLGVTATPGPATRSDGRGLGCHVSQSSVAYWLSTPDFSTSASLSGYRLVCGCTL